MRILDLLKSKTLKRQRELVLDEGATQHWPMLLVEHAGLDREFKEFSERLAELKDRIGRSVKDFTDEDTLSAIPDRARTINAIHGKEYATQVHKLLKAAEFTDLFSFDQQQIAYLEAASAFKDMSSKHVSVLKEFMHDELKRTQEQLQELEDTVIMFMKTLDDRKFPTVRKLHETNKKLAAMSERHDKYKKLLTSLKADLKRTQNRRVEIEEQISEQRALIRNDASLAALTRIQTLEAELFHTAHQYGALGKDLHTLYQKHPELKMTEECRKTITELQKDHTQFLSGNSELIKRAFGTIIEQLEEENLGNRNLLERLTRLAASSDADSRRIATAAPDLRGLKRDVMKDVAALQVYDKQQSLLRAQGEEGNIQMKISYLEQELDPQKRIAMEREMKDLAKGFGAIVKGKEPPAESKTDDVEEPDIEPEHDDAALK